MPCDCDKVTRLLPPRVVIHRHAMSCYNSCVYVRINNPLHEQLDNGCCDYKCAQLVLNNANKFLYHWLIY